MAKILIVGGGFGGVVAAETLAKSLGNKHEIIMLSRDAKFIFYPSLVRVAFGKERVENASFDLTAAMHERGVRFITGEVARLDAFNRRVSVAGGDFEGDMTYDYLVFALGRRLATERVTGFFEYGNHVLSPKSALAFGNAVREFKGGHVVLGCCPEARLPVPVYETAFALARHLDEKGIRDAADITVVSPDSSGEELGGPLFHAAITRALEDHGIEVIHDFSISEITAGAVRSDRNQYLKFDLLTLIPPFRGPGAVIGLGITDPAGFIRVLPTMRVKGVDRMYAVGDCVGLPGAKLGHMAVQQGRVAAENVIAEIEGREPTVNYDHEIMLVIDEGGSESIFLHQHPKVNDEEVHTGRFWSWAKWVHERYWTSTHN